MKNRQKIILYWLIAFLVAASIVSGLIYYSSLPGPYDFLAKCVAEKETKFYGAYWCSACAKQKTVFGRSAQYLPYIECSDPGQRNQNELCATAGIQQYPTWEFANGERSVGVLSPEELAEKTSCSIQVEG